MSNREFNGILELGLADTKLAPPPTWKCGHCGDTHGLDVPFCAGCVMIATNPYTLARPEQVEAPEPPPPDKRLRCELDVRRRVAAEPRERDPRLAKLGVVAPARAFIFRARVFDGPSEVKCIERTGEVSALIPREAVPGVLRRLLGNLARQAKIELGVGDGEWVVSEPILPNEIGP